MNKTLNSLHPRQYRQSRGAVLAISMVMMLLITTIGIAGMRSSQMETVMAKNILQKKTSFNNAESAALIGETTWDDTIVSCMSSIKECPDATLANLTPPMVEGIQSIDWDSGETAGIFGNYFVEYLGQRMVPGDMEKTIQIYRLTTRATDNSGTSKTLVQTLYRRCLKVDGVPCPD